MEIQDIMTLINSAGFPIACCVALFWQTNNMNKQHKEEMDKIQVALNNNTTAIIQLSERLKKEG